MEISYLIFQHSPQSKYFNSYCYKLYCSVLEINHGDPQVAIYFIGFNKPWYLDMLDDDDLKKKIN